MRHGELKDLLRLLEVLGGKFVIVEEGKPVAVLLSFKEFENLAAAGLTQELALRLKKIEEINDLVTRAQLLDLPEEKEPQQPEEIRIEPLPR